MKKGERYLYLCPGLAPTPRRGQVFLAGKSIKFSKEPFFCPSQQSPSALLPSEDSWLLLSVQVAAPAEKAGGERREGAGPPSDPHQLGALPLLCPRQKPFSPFVCVMKNSQPFGW